MIKAVFTTQHDAIVHFAITGHAESGPYGQDLVCAAVSGIVGGMLNVLDERYGDDVAIVVGDNIITIDVKKSSSFITSDLAILKTQLATIEVQYPKNIRIKEVH